MVEHKYSIQSAIDLENENILKSGENTLEPVYKERYYVYQTSGCCQQGHQGRESSQHMIEIAYAVYTQYRDEVNSLRVHRADWKGGY
jgi:hypothetical protein